MATIGRDTNGRRRILFVAPDGKRKTIRLGKIPQRAAEAIKVKVEHLVATAVSGCGWDNETARWVAELPNALADKLASVELIPRRTEAAIETLGPFLDFYITTKAKLKPNTLRNYEVTRKHLITHFRATKKLAQVSPGDADEWREALRKNLSPATVSREVKRARQFFRAAVRKRLIAENPFSDLPTPAQVNASRDHFVTRDVTEKIIEACPDAEWRLIVALSRYGGLRCPSEHLRLRWEYVDWEHEQIMIQSPKTAHHSGGEFRVIPLFPELRPYLEAVWGQADTGTEHIITRYRSANTNLRTQFLRIIRLAGIEPWPKLFHNMRASCETDLARIHPIHVVCNWVGNSQSIAAKHYLQVTESDFKRALQGGTESGTVGAPNNEKAAQNPAQQPAAQLRTDSQETKKARGNRAVLLPTALACEVVQLCTVPPRGVEPLSSD